MKIVYVSLFIMLGIGGGVVLSFLLSPNHVSIHTPQGVIYAEVVDTPALRAQGLSGRDRMSDDQGMWFVFPREGKHGIWMKDMNFAIDIIWLNKEKKIVSIKEEVRPESFPRTFRPHESALYVLEIPSGGVDNYELRQGMTLVTD